MGIGPGILVQALVPDTVVYRFVMRCRCLDEASQNGR